MEVTANSQGSVHVLRHSFRPSEYLAIALERYMQPGVTRPRSLLYASRLVTVDTLHYPLEEINVEYELANRAFLKHYRDKIAVGGMGEAGKRVAVRKQRDGGLRVGLLPRSDDDKQVFNTLLTGFDIFPEAERTEVPETPIRYFLYATIPANVVDFDAATRATQALTQELARFDLSHRYTVSPSVVDRQIIPIPASLPQPGAPED